MNTQEVERLVTAALHADAEDAMSRTSTTEQLESHVEARARDDRNWRRLLAGGALAAVAAAAVLGVVVVRSEDHEGTPPPANQPSSTQVKEAEQTVEGFLGALASFDRAAASTYVAEGAEPTMGGIVDDSHEVVWTLRNRWDEATGWQVTAVDSCQGRAHTSAEVGVRCLYTAHQLGSDELGRGPFGGNMFLATVRDGEIVDISLITAHDTNGFADTMWNPFWNWMGKAHPNDESRMKAAENPNSSPAQVTSSLELWQRRVQEYVDAVRAGDAQ